MTTTSNLAGAIHSRRLLSQLALILGIAALLFALSTVGVSADESEVDDGSGAPVALDAASSINDENQSTTGQTEVGSAEDIPTQTPAPTPTPTPTATAATTDEGEDSGVLPETSLEGETGTSTGAATGESEGLTQETEESGEVETTDEPILHPLVVTVFNCETDPGASLPQDHPDCSAVVAASVVVQVASVSVGDQPTDVNGQASFEIEEGSTAVISQDPTTVPAGYSAAIPVEVLVEGPAAAQLVNVADEVVPPATQGAFQIASGQCFTGGDPYTEIMIVGPMVRAAAQECGPLAGAGFTITGGSLTEPMGLTTDGGGSWTGYLDPGDYVISRAGASVGFSIIVDQITVAVAVDWIAGPKGTVGVQRYTCTEGDINGTVITLIDGGGGGAPNASCVASDANVQLFSSGSSAEPLNLNGNGTEVPVAAGEYVVRDVTGVEQALTVVEGGFIQALIVEIRLTGVVSAQVNVCADPSSNFEDPSQPGYWTSNCGPAAAGTNVALLDAAGNVAASTQTGGGGSAYFEDILAGTYVLDVEAACALFADGSDARAGFAVGPNQVVNVAAYECAKPSNPNPGGGNNNGGGNDGGGSQTGGDPDGNGSGSVGSLPDQLFSLGDSRPAVETSQAPELFVTTLPAIGTGQAATSSLWAAILLVAAVTCLLAIRLAMPIKLALAARSRG